MKDLPFIDAGKFIDYVRNLRAERDSLALRCAQLEAYLGMAPKRPLLTAGSKLLCKTDLTMRMLKFHQGQRYEIKAVAAEGFEVFNDAAGSYALVSLDQLAKHFQPADYAIAEPCSSCGPNGVMATDGSGPFDCPDCGKPASASTMPQTDPVTNVSDPTSKRGTCGCEGQCRNWFLASDEVDETCHAVYGLPNA